MRRRARAGAARGAAVVGCRVGATVGTEVWLAARMAVGVGKLTGSAARAPSVAYVWAVGMGVGM